MWNLVWNATFTLIAIIISSMIFDEAGFFEFIAFKIARIAKGKGVVLFLLLMLLCSGISTFFTNDGAILVMTPITYSVLTRTGIKGKSALPFVMGIGIIADTASSPLVVSNLTNILTASYFRIPFLTYSSVMIVPDLVSVAATVVLLFLFYRKVLRVSGFQVQPGTEYVIRDPVIFKIALPFIASLMLLYSIGSVYNVPVAVISVSAVAVLSLIAAFRKRVNVMGIIRHAPWQIVLFSLGMYLIVFGMGREGFTFLVSSVIRSFSVFPDPVFVVLSGLFFALMASCMNNLPSIMIGNLAINGMQGQHLLAYINIVSNNIGTKFTPIGSLATLLWFHTLQRKGQIGPGYLYYMKVGIVVALPVLLLTLLTLWLIA